MCKNFQKISSLISLSLILFSCASGAPPSEPSASSYESGRLSQRASESGNDERMITYSVSMDLSVKNPEETRKALTELIKINNGYIAKESDNYITARIPSENMDNFINNAKALGKTENESKTGTDITDQYRDNVIRLESLKNVRGRYLSLLEKANTVSDVLLIEKELERVNTEIELLEGKIKYAELNVTYANIMVRFRESAKPGPIGWIFYGLFYGIKWLFVWD
ncbi:MAG: DUF4349 domain-containing protein [Treponema sp.]|jgi:hypothetical protein|nr:DUF4349 domain-containing protein [Treponema sp.]